MRNKHRGPNSTGGASKPLPKDDGRFYPIGPVAAQVGLCRALLAKNLTPGERAFVGSLLGYASEKPLTATQFPHLERLAKAYGAVYEERADAQPWGPLPLKPPGRAA